MKVFQKRTTISFWVVMFFLTACHPMDFQNQLLSTPFSTQQPTASLTSITTIQTITQIPVPSSSYNLDSETCSKIAVSVVEGEESNIYTLCEDGSNLTRLTENSYNNSDPAWSPDGSRIAFASSRAGKSQIFVMDREGNNPIQLTDEFQNDSPIWLADGDHMAFRTFDGTGLFWWRVMDMNTLEITQISAPSYDFFFQTPAWSPDGQFVAYMSLEEQKLRNDGSSQIHIKNMDGSIDRALTNDVWANINPIWSPDSTRIAFLSERDGTYNQFALYVISRDGTKIQRLTEPVYDENAHYSWSPDGQQIAILASINSGNILILDLAGGDSREITGSMQNQSISSLAWQP